MRAGAGGAYSTYELYVPRNLPSDAEGMLHGAVRPALTAAPIKSGTGGSIPMAKRKREHPPALALISSSSAGSNC